MRGWPPIPSSTSDQVSDPKATSTAASAASADGYGRPAAIASANRCDAQQASIAETASLAEAALNAASVN